MLGSLFVQKSGINLAEPNKSYKFSIKPSLNKIIQHLKMGRQSQSRNGKVNSITISILQHIQQGFLNLNADSYLSTLVVLNFFISLLDGCVYISLTFCIMYTLNLFHFNIHSVK